MCIGKCLHRLGQIIRAFGGLSNIGGGNRHQSNHGARDHPRQPHTTTGRPETLGVLRGRTGVDFTIGTHQIQLHHMLAERSGMVMIFAMHVGRNHAADGDKSRTRRHRNKPAARYKHAKYIG